MTLKVPSKTIWILEDDAGCQFVYEQILGLRYTLRFFSNLASFNLAIQEEETAIDLLIADLRLPDQSFVSYLASQSLHRKFGSFPMLIVSSVDDLDVLRLCFEKGAIDYITKPFGKNELIVKLERIFSKPSTPPALTDIHTDPVSMTVSRRDRKSAPLTVKEMQILQAFLRNPAELLSREELVNRVWGNIKVHPKALDVHLAHLRKKIGQLDVEIRFIFPNNFHLLCDGVNPSEPVLNLP